MTTPLQPQDGVLDRLVEKELLSAAERGSAEDAAAADPDGRGVTYHVVRMGLLKSRVVARELAKFFGVQAVDMSMAQIDPDTLGVLPEDVIVRHHVVPLQRDDNGLMLAMVDPTDFETLDDIRFELDGISVVPVVADEYSIRSFVEARFGATTTMEDVLAELSEADLGEAVETEDESIAGQYIQEQVDTTPAVRLVNAALAEGIKRGASDIHVEQYERSLVVRFRIDGVMVKALEPPAALATNIVYRIKHLARMNATERRIPQDGRIRFRSDRTKVTDFRVNTLPTQFGERITLRVLDRSAISLELSALGMDDGDRKVLEREVAAPHGMVLVTGPTGSGKTTTLYSVLGRLNRPDVNILTVEDPIEYNFPGISQVPVTRDMTLARALKAFLRQDPNIIMVGEIRDTETAATAVRAAFTGHMVLSTMHTNDAASTVARLVEIGVESFNVATSLSLVVAQRLVRRICPYCREDAPFDPAIAEGLGLSEAEWGEHAFQRGRGCARCRGGYRGRVGLYELLRVTPEVRVMILEGASTAKIQQQALRDGMRTLRMCGLDLARRGMTTATEILRETTT